MTPVRLADMTPAQRAVVAAYLELLRRRAEKHKRTPAKEAA